MNENINKIAVIGFSGQFPGAQDVEEFWENIFAGVNGLITYKREDIDQAHNNSGLIDNKNYRAVGGGPKGMKNFDASFFGISPKEALLMDPQHRKFLETAYLAFEHAGYNPFDIKQPVAIFASEGVNTYLLSNIIDSSRWSEDQEAAIYGCGYDYLATRVSYLLNLKGPSLTVQSGCSSSLLAVHLGIKSLLSFECDMALVGGVSILTPFPAGYVYQDGGILSESGVCRPFDAQADGTIFSNGYGAVILKRLDDAIQDRDTIYATILSSAVNNDGNDKISYSAPGVAGQRDVILSALAFADISPESIGYIECHGTGTKLGDPIEIKALQSAYNQFTSRKHFCAIGSIKSTIGHMNSAAGIAGFLNVIGSLYKKRLLGIKHFTKPNSEINFEDSPFYVLNRSVTWESNAPRRAAISSFGIGGTNIHMVLEEYQATNLMQKNINKQTLFALSAKTEDSLKRIIDKWIKYLENHINLNINDICFTLAVGRPVFEFRVAIVTNGCKDLLSQLKTVKCSKALPNSKIINAKETTCESLKIAFEQGIKINWNDFFDQNARKIALPTYAFQEDCYWLDIEQRAEQAIFKNHKNPDLNQWFYTQQYIESDIKKSNVPIPNNWLIFDAEDSLVEQIKLFCPKASVTVVKQETVKEKKDYITIFENLNKIGKMPDIIVHGFLMNKMPENNPAVLESGLFSVMYIIQALNETAVGHKCRIAIIAKDIATLSNNEELNPLKATIFGLTRTINKEYSHHSCILMDIDRLNSLSMINDIVFSEDEFVVYRGWQRFIEHYRAINVPADALNLIDGTYIITGGLGCFGLDIADVISEHIPMVNLVLLDRVPFPSKDKWANIIKEHGPSHGLVKKILRLQALEMRGSSVSVESVNVMDLIALKKIYKKADNNKPVKGIIHAAGVVESSILDRKTPKSFDCLFDAKVWGSINVVKAANDYNPDFILLCSSMNSMIGGLGQADNTASTSFVDYFARYCRNNGNKNVFALNWGAVNQSRVREFESLPEFQTLSQEHLKNRMTEEERKIIFKRILASGKNWYRIVISTIDINCVLKEWNKVSSIKALTQDRKIQFKSRAELHHLKDVPLQEPSTNVEKILCAHVQEILGIDKVSRLDNFFELGGHSLSAIRLNEKIKRDFGLQLHAMTIYEYPVIRDISDFIKTELDQKLFLNQHEG
ncbi:MAG: beta-ketoacyl synthase N-terminal-like domain-containing protein [Candidatus Babeliales bacterium]